MVKPVGKGQDTHGFVKSNTRPEERKQNNYPHATESIHSILYRSHVGEECLPSLPIAGGICVEVWVTLGWGRWNTQVETLWEGPRFVPIVAWGPLVWRSFFLFSPQSSTDPGWPGTPDPCPASWSH